METYWTYEVMSIEGEKKRSLVIAPCDSLAQAMAGAFKDADVLHRRVRIQGRARLSRDVQGV